MQLSVVNSFCIHNYFINKLILYKYTISSTSLSACATQSNSWTGNCIYVQNISPHDCTMEHIYIQYMKISLGELYSV